MNYNEIKGDLFKSLNRDTATAHCISSDLAMGAGIAVSFNKTFNLKDEFFRLGCSTSAPNCIMTNFNDNNIFCVFNLITKSKYYQKPTYSSLEKSLNMMKTKIVKHNIKTVNIPKIGSGLDKLSWSKVKEMIHNIFGDLDININVYYI